MPFDPQLRATDPYERFAWLESESDIINDKALIDLRNQKTGRRWLALSGFSKWTGFGVRDGEKELQRDTWFQLTCIVVRCKDQAKMVENLRDKILTDPNSFPEIELRPRDFFLGEYPGHPEMSELDRWSLHDDLQTFAVPIRPAVAYYECESGGYDYSINRTVRVAMPAPWLAQKMGLRLASGRSLIFVDSEGRDMFYDPSVVEDGPAAALVDRDAFLKILNRQDLSAIWVIAGAKSAYGGSAGGMGFGGQLRHTGIYHLDDEGFARHLYIDRQHPSPDQLKKFFGEDPAPSGIMTKPTDL